MPPSAEGESINLNWLAFRHCRQPDQGMSKNVKQGNLDVMRGQAKGSEQSPPKEMAPAGDVFASYVFAKPEYANFPKAEPAQFVRPDARESLSVEHRTKLIEKLNTAIENQNYYGAVQMLGTTTAMMGISIARRRPDANLMVLLSGLGVSSASAINAGLAGGAAKDVLKSMPQADAERFSKYNKELALTRDAVFGGYGFAGAFAMLNEKAPIKHPTVAASAAVMATGLDLYTNLYTRRNVTNNFQADFAAWKREMQKT